MNKRTTPKCIEAAKKLAAIYRRITLEQIKKKIKANRTYTPEDALWEMTGFGRRNSCIICNAVGNCCANCIYNIEEEGYFQSQCACTKHETYKDIQLAGTPVELFGAIQRRAAYIESLIKEYE